MHVGCMGLAPKSHDSVDSIPPMPTGGNLDNKRIGVGTTMYYPVEVAGALLSMGDAHAAQGDGEIDGTAIETSITGTFKITLIKKTDADKPAWFPILDFPLGETADTFSSTRLHRDRLPRDLLRQPGRHLRRTQFGGRGAAAGDVQRVHADAQVPDGHIRV